MAPDRAATLGLSGDEEFQAWPAWFNHGTA
jgi:hypothetical protein